MTLLLRDRLEGDLVIEVAFIGSALDVGDRAEASVRVAGLAVVAAETGAEPVIMRQVHGAAVALVDDLAAPTPEADGLVTSRRGVALLARAADCVPLLLGDPYAGVAAAVHSGRGGLVAGVVPAAVSRMRDLGADRITAWLGPYVCGACYEVPDGMRSAVAEVVPEAWSVTSWDTPAVDLGAGVRTQLAAAGVEVVHEMGGCTREDPGFPSHRRDGDRATRFAGVVWMRP